MHLLVWLCVLVLTCIADCPFGKFGEDCNQNCSTNCRALPNGDPHCKQDSGVCSEGCILGFYRPTCNANCSENCPRKLCHLYEGTCLLSCENNRCGSYCDSDCNSITTTPGNGDGAKRSHVLKGMTVREMIIVLIYLTTTAADNSCQNCEDNKCDVNDKCVDGCKRGFAGDKCLHKCSANCLELKCELNMHSGNYPCLIGCTPGYHGYQCNAPCKTIDKDGMCDRYSGTSPDCAGTRYGTNCETSCLSNCNGSVCDNTGKCFRDLCIPGRYGSGCRNVCESNCKLCHNNTGECILFEDKGEPESSKFSGDVQVREESVYFPVITALLVIIAIGIMFQTADICMRWKERLNPKTASKNFFGGASNPNQLRISSSSTISMTELGKNYASGSQADSGMNGVKMVCIPVQSRSSSSGFETSSYSVTARISDSSLDQRKSEEDNTCNV